MFLERICFYALGPESHLRNPNVPHYQSTFLIQMRATPNLNQTLSQKANEWGSKSRIRLKYWWRLCPWGRLFPAHVSMYRTRYSNDFRTFYYRFRREYGQRLLCQGSHLSVVSDWRIISAYKLIFYARVGT